jgi:hypothetical protein
MELLLLPVIATGLALVVILLALFAQAIADVFN